MTGYQDRQTLAWGLPSSRLRPGLVLNNVLHRPLYMLAVLYSIAICFERLVEVEIFKPYRLIGLLLVAGVIVRGRVRFDRLPRLMLVFLGIGFLAGIPLMVDNLGREDIFLNTVLLWTFNLATYVAVASVISSRRDVLVLAFVHGVAMLTAAYGIAQDAAATELGSMLRQTGDFKNPANASVSMLFGCLVILSWMRRRAAHSRGIPRLALWGVSWLVPVFLVFTASLTGSRAGTALMIVGIFYYMMMRSKRKPVLVTVGAGIIALAILGVGSDRDEALSSLSDSNILAARVEKKGVDTDRLYLWKSGLDALMDRYGLGVGVARYPELHKEYFARYAQLSDPRWMLSDLTLHNDYVNALVEHGVIGFFFFVSICVYLVRTSRSIANPDIRAIALSFLLGLAINGVTHTGLPYFAVWFYFALLTSWRRCEIVELRQELEAIRA